MAEQGRGSWWETSLEPRATTAEGSMQKAQSEAPPPHGETYLQELHQIPTRNVTKNPLRLLAGRGGKEPSEVARVLCLSTRPAFRETSQPESNLLGCSESASSREGKYLTSARSSLTSGRKEIHHSRPLQPSFPLKGRMS